MRKRDLGWHPKQGSPSYDLEPSQRETVRPGSESLCVEGGELLNPNWMGIPFCSVSLQATCLMPSHPRMKGQVPQHPQPSKMASKSDSALSSFFLPCFVSFAFVPSGPRRLFPFSSFIYLSPS